MNWVRRLRNQAGITQHVLANRARTSQSTVAMYETGVKSPSLNTFQKLADSLGFEVFVTFAPRMTREDHRSLAYHEAISRKLMKNSVMIKARAERTLLKMQESQPGAKALFERWKIWLKLPTEELIFRILNPGMEAREMRQVSPFAGILSPKERFQILSKFRFEYSPRSKDRETT